MRKTDIRFLQNQRYVLLELIKYLFKNWMIIKFSFKIFLYTFSLIFGNFSDSGPYDIEIHNGYLITSNGDSTEYRLFSPLNGPSAPHIIFAHEFVSTHDYLLNLSQHYASWGLKVATMNQIHSSLIDNDPIQDAENLILLSNQVFGGGDVIYAGYSAGGLRSLIASVFDTNTVAFFGLDVVDIDDLGQSYADELNIPIFGLAGEASSCNSQSNGISIYNDAENSKLLRVTEADHCDFQSPNSLLCTFLCENENNLFSPDQINLLIKNLSTAFFTWQTSINMDGELWWTNGSEVYDSLITNNSISELVNTSLSSNSLIPQNFKLYQNYPNPFNSYTTIKLDLENKLNVEINIYDLGGRLVKKIFKGLKQEGSHAFLWNSKDNMSKNVASGVYLYEIKIENLNIIKKMLFLK